MRLQRLALVVSLMLVGLACTDDPTEEVVDTTTMADPQPDEVPCPDAEDPPHVDEILRAFESTPVVALGEEHGSAAFHAVLAQLVCDPRFPDAVDAVVVEFGNARLQRVLDRYVLVQQPVGQAELAAVWRETTQTSGVWDNPVYAAFFGRVRTINTELATTDQVRVLAGDPPVDMDEVTDFGACNDRDPACIDHWVFQRDEHLASVVLDQLDEDHTVLVIAGRGHLEDRTAPEPLSVPQLVEAEQPGSVTVLVPG